MLNSETNLEKRKRKYEKTLEQILQRENGNYELRLEIYNFQRKSGHFIKVRFITSNVKRLKNTEIGNTLTTTQHHKLVATDFTAAWTIVVRVVGANARMGTRRQNFVGADTDSSMFCNPRFKCTCG